MQRISLILVGVLSLGMFFVVGCSQEVSHSESDRPHILDNGETHSEQTTYRNPDGTYTTESSKSKTSN